MHADTQHVVRAMTWVALNSGVDTIPPFNQQHLQSSIDERTISLKKLKWHEKRLVENESSCNTDKGTA